VPRSGQAIKKSINLGLIVGTGGGPQARKNTGSGWTLARALVGLRVGIAGDREHRSCRDGQPEGKAWKVTACEAPEGRYCLWHAYFLFN